MTCCLSPSIPCIVCFSRFGILYCCSKAKRFHGIGDESHKDGASVFLTGVRAEFDTADGVETADALIDIKFVLNQVSNLPVHYLSVVVCNPAVVVLCSCRLQKRKQ